MDEEITFVEVLGLFLIGLAAYFAADMLTSRAPAPGPATPEERVDAVVAALNRTFGRDWITASTNTLKDSLRRVLPARLLSLVDVVHMIEDCSTDRPLSGATKRWWAASYALREGLL